MSLVHETRQAMQSIPNFHGGAVPFSVIHGSERLLCDLTALDTLGCAFERFALASDRLAGASIDRLKAIAGDLSKRLTYLLEAISPIEVDAEACHVQMRSNPPRKGDDGSTYYELDVRRGGELSLRRYRKLPGQPREAIPAQITREVFLHLVSDFAAAVK